jgi:aspartyl-tRNA(Asn)/glutamyl-tRNA(Gln) amidotransferase subunit A
VSHADELELCFASIDDLSQQLATRDVSPVEVTEALLNRIERHNEEMRVYITVTRDVALEQARQAEREIQSGNYRGPLHGIPVSLKDNVATAGIRTSCASLVAPDWVPDEDATVYAKLREAGAVLAGKANLYEYAFSISPAFPQPLNPWNPERMSSGSSSGSGVGVAAGMSHGSIGSDTGGSGRAPANFNGAVGFKATYGRVSRAGLVPLSFSLDHTTVMTRTVSDSAHMLQAVSGHDPRDENSAEVPVPDLRAKLGRDIAGMRIGIARGYTYEDIDEDVVRVMRSAAGVFERLGAHLEEVRLPYVEHAVSLQMAIMHPEAADIHYDAYRETPENFGPTALMRLDVGNIVPATAYIRAQRFRKLLRDAFRTMFDRFDVILSPALPMRAGPAGEWTTTVGGHELDLRTVGPEYTGIYNLAGNPAIVLPGGFSHDDMPIGIQLAGKWWDEPTVLQAAHAFEQATEWHTLRPPFPKD